MTNCKCCGQPIIKDSFYKNDAMKAIMYLNKVVGSKYKHTATNLNFVIGRLREGHTLKDIEDVIDSKHNEWKNTDSAIYLRPATLFNATKFNQYVGQVDVVKQATAKAVDPYRPVFVDQEKEPETKRTDDKTAFAQLEEMRKARN